MIPALPCGTFSDSDTPAGAFYVAAFEDGDQTHLLLIGLDGEARFGDRQLGCIAILPVGVD